MIGYNEQSGRQSHGWLAITVLLSIIFSLGFGGCATAQQLVLHGFSFDARRDSPGIEILDYRYGDSKFPGARAREPSVKGGSIAQWTSTIGSMRRGDELYVKWQIKKTGEVREDTVNLRNRLPADITEHRIYFIVRDTQLFIYLISPDKRSNTDPLGPLPMYADRKVATIYPDSMRR